MFTLFPILLQNRNYFAKRSQVLLISCILNGLMGEVCKTAPYADRLREDMYKNLFFALVP